jgi:hypothetical protein
MVNKDIFFGSQNFFYVASDTTDGTYDYVAFMSAKGAILLARYTKLGTIDTGRYCLITGVFATIWTAKASQNYVLPNQVEAINF